MPELPLTEPLETTIEEPEGSIAALEAATNDADVAAVAARFPTCLAAWATLGELALDADQAVRAYAYFRVGYHRGLDRIRQAGWRGRGRVPWSHAPNRGFLRSLRGLAQAAGAIGEQGEAERCKTFLAELAPDAPRPFRDFD
jgi:hypothetical protein